MNVNEEKKATPPELIDVWQLARAIRFAMVAMVLPLSYLSLRSSLSVATFGAVFHDMLGGKPLPALTQFVFAISPVLIGFAFLAPILALATLFLRKVVLSFYILGVLGFLTVVEFILLYHGLSAPLFEIIKAMGGNS